MVTYCMIKFIAYGDIFSISGISCYAHGCNCAGAMGKGIALQFKKRFPQMYLQYRKKCLQNQFHPGDVFEFVQGTQRIYNLGTQKTWRTNATLEAIELSVRKMLKLATEQHVKDIAMPKIGAGLGGLPWEDVKLLLQQLAMEYPTVNLIVVENYNNGISIQ